MHRQSKYKAIPVICDGIRFPSKHEARAYQNLILQKASGSVSYFLRQVPIHLPGGVTLRIDFQVFYADGTCRYLDAKGVETRSFKEKRKIAEALYPIKIETI